jgi:MobA/MobL family
LEGRKDAQLAREVNLALPHELDCDARRGLLLNFVREAFVSRGMVADVAVHEPVLAKGDHPHNHHEGASQSECLADFAVHSGMEPACAMDTSDKPT